MSNVKFTQCNLCGVILDQNVDLEDNHNLIAVCQECFYKHILANSLAGMPVIDDHIDPQVVLH